MILCTNSKSQKMTGSRMTHNDAICGNIQYTNLKSDLQSALNLMESTWHLNAKAGNSVSLIDLIMQRHDLEGTQNSVLSFLCLLTPCVLLSNWSQGL